MDKLNINTQLNKTIDNKKKWLFWDTQPVLKLNTKTPCNNNCPIEKKEIVNVQKDSYLLPNNYFWDIININNEESLNEIYELLNNNYSEDENNMFRLNYSKDFLRWALKKPGYFLEWNLGIRNRNHKLIGFISGVPSNIFINNKLIKIPEINFLCIHKSLRSNRLAPLLIKEITRRVNLQNIWQAVYTASILIPKPVSNVNYFYFLLNIKKLIKTKYYSMENNISFKNLKKRYQLPSKVKNNLRPMNYNDINDVRILLNNYLKQFKLTIQFSNEEIEHIFLPKNKIIYSFVIEKNKKITDFCSYYLLPYNILNKNSNINTAYLHYYAVTSIKLSDMIKDILIICKNDNIDLFIILNIMNNHKLLEDINLYESDEKLYYYLYNWKCKTLDKGDIGLSII